MMMRFAIIVFIHFTRTNKFFILQPVTLLLLQESDC